MGNNDFSSLCQQYSKHRSHAVDAAYRLPPERRFEGWCALWGGVLYSSRRERKGSSSNYRRLSYRASIDLPASQNPPLVLPMYHIGMHQIASETPTHKRGRGKLSKIMPNRGKFLCVCWAGGTRLSAEYMRRARLSCCPLRRTGLYIGVIRPNWINASPVHHGEPSKPICFLVRLLCSCIFIAVENIP